MPEFTRTLIPFSVCFGNSYYKLTMLITDDEEQAKGLVSLWCLLSVSSIFREFGLVTLILGENKVCK